MVDLEGMEAWVTGYYTPSRKGSRVSVENTGNVLLQAGEHGGSSGGGSGGGSRLDLRV